MRGTKCRIERRYYLLAGRLSAIPLTPQFYRNLRFQLSSITQSRPTTSTSGGKGTKFVERNASRVEEQLLSRAQTYGLNSIEDLHRESRLAALDTSGTYLVDHPPHRFELPLWEILLDYQLLHYGPQSVQTIWRGLKHRGRSVLLTSDDSVTTTFWLKLLKAAVQSEDIHLLKLLCRKDGLAWNRPKLFAEVIGTCLRYGTETQALKMMAHLRLKSLTKQSSIMDFYNILEPESQTDLTCFLKFLSHFPPEKIYAQVMPRIWSTRGYENAITLHKLLISKNDLPTSLEEIKPFLTYFAEHKQGATRFLQHLKSSGANFVTQAQAFYEDAVAQIEDSHSHKRRIISDSFAARLFATKTLSFDFILNSLLLFGSIDIGPQSIREIGLSASTLESFQSRLSRLDELHIDTGSHAYSRLVRKLCLTRQETLLKAALHTSMHHDVFEDVFLLRRLLLESLNKSSWERVNLLLSILNNGDVFDRDIHARQQILDLLYHDEERERLVLSFYPDGDPTRHEQEIDLARLAFESLSCNWTDKRIEGDMARSKLRRIKFLTGLLQDSVAAGRDVPFHQWTLALRLIRKFGSLSDIIGLYLWIAKRYLAPLGGAEYHTGMTAIFLLRPARIINARYQGMLVSKAFQKDLSDGLSRTRWKNLELVLKFFKYVETNYDITIDLQTIRRVLARNLRSDTVKSRVYRAISGRPAPSARPTGTLVKVMRMVYNMWATKSPVFEEELKLALESLRDTKKFSRTNLYKQTTSTSSAALPLEEAMVHQ